MVDSHPTDLVFETPAVGDPVQHSDAREAVADLIARYRQSTNFLRTKFAAYMVSASNDARYRACYPELRIHTSGHAPIDSRLSFGHVSMPGHYSTTITRPDLFANYLEKATDRIYQMNYDGTDKKEIILPGVGSASSPGGREEYKTLFYTFTSFLYPPTIFKYDVESGESTLFLSACSEQDAHGNSPTVIVD